MAQNRGMETLTELRALIVRHSGGGRKPGLMGGGLRLSTFTAPNPPVHIVHEPVFALIAQGAKRIVLADRVFDARANQFSVVPVDLPISFRVTEASEETPYLSVAWALKPSLVASVLLESGVRGSHGDDTPAIGVSWAPGNLVDAVSRLLRLLDQPSDIPILQPMIEREIVWRLLCSDQGDLVRQIGLTDGRLSKISRAIRWIREHYAETLRIENLAESVAMSPTSFHRHFRAVAAMSPLQYQKHIRLQEARSRLMIKGDDVASIGFSVGYDSPSQFSREYARLFGAPPGRDAAGLRAALLTVT